MSKHILSQHIYTATMIFFHKLYDMKVRHKSNQWRFLIKAEEVFYRKKIDFPHDASFFTSSAIDYVIYDQHLRFRMIGTFRHKLINTACNM